MFGYIFMRMKLVQEIFAYPQLISKLEEIYIRFCCVLDYFEFKKGMEDGFNYFKRGFVLSPAFNVMFDSEYP